MDLLFDPDTITAIGAAIAAVLSVILVRKVRQGPVDKSAAHQEIVRPETKSEQRQAAALESIAKNAERIERHLDIFLSGRPPHN